jgi:hypothetical protein
MMAELRPRVEQKFFLPPARTALALALVRRTCRWDSEYPAEQINSLYFDTPELEQYERSSSGEFAKAKVRIRWYGSDNDPHRSVSSEGHGAPTGETVPAWLELKERRGFSSTKQRSMVQVAEHMLRPDVLVRGIVPASLLIESMAGFGFLATKRLCPVVAVSYWRWRFVEPRTGFKIAFDTDIRSSMVMAGIGWGERGLRLAGAVVEVKGASAELPTALRELADLGSSWTRFSKYSASIDAHAADLCSVSRSWPSGVLHVESCTGVTNNG